MAKRANSKKEPTLKPGWWAAVVLSPGAAPLRGHVGQIQAVDAKGLRLTLVDWFTGMAASWDLYVPRRSLESALVATDRHHLKNFGDDSAKWQEAMDADRGKHDAPPANPE